jgi:hypothetical protein
MRAQAHIDCYLIRTVASPGARDIPVEVRHENYP